MHRFPRRLQWTAIITVIFLILFSRAPSILFYPPLQAEDGVEIFAHFYQQRGLGEIFRSKAGYIPLIANLVGYLSVRLPTRSIPYGLAWLPLLLTLLTYGRFFSLRYRCVLPADSSRALVCVLFALAPLAQYHLIAHTDYSLWNCLALLILLAVLPFGPARRTALLTALAVNILIWSHPLALIILPFQLAYLVKDQPNRILYQLTLLNLVLHQFLGVKSVPILAHSGVIDLGFSLVHAVLGTFTIVAKLAFRAAFGQALMIFAVENMELLIAEWAMLVSGFTGLVWWRCPRYRLTILTLIYLVFAITFLAILSRGHAVAGDIVNGIRYGYLQSLAFLVLWVVLLDALLHDYSSLVLPLSTTPSSEAARHADTDLQVHRRRWGAGLFALMILHYYGLNAQMGHYFLFNSKSQSPYFAAHPNNGMIVRQFFQDLELQEQNKNGRSGIWLMATKLYDWPIIIIDTHTHR